MQSKQVEPKLKPWMWVAMIVALGLTVFSIDPIGNLLVKTFGKSADMWAVNLVLVSLIIYALTKRK